MANRIEMPTHSVITESKSLQVLKFEIQPWVSNPTDSQFMCMAIEQAKFAAKNGEVPIGAVLVHDSKVIATGSNETIALSDPSAHAEIQALRAACKHFGNYRLPEGCVLYVTLQPCLMCMGALAHSRLSRLVVGARESRYAPEPLELAQFMSQVQAFQGFEWQCGCQEFECQTILQDFFQHRRLSRLQSISQLKSLRDLPNVNEDTLILLASIGLKTPVDILNSDLETTAQRIELLATQSPTQVSVQISDRQRAVLLSVRDYCLGLPSKSWKEYL